jgi:hypothetical protein
MRWDFGGGVPGVELLLIDDGVVLVGEYADTVGY